MRKRKKHREYDPILDPHSLAIVRQAATKRKSGLPAQTNKSLDPTRVFHIATINQPVSKPASSAVLIIPRFESKTLNEPERIVIIKDYEKSTLGFPFGGIETGNNGFIDIDRTQAARREILEEIFNIPQEEFSEEKAAILGVVITEQDFIGTIRKTHNHIIHVCSLILPASARPKLKPGKEQQAVLAVKPSKIDEYIEEDIFLDTHAKGWEMYKQQFNK
ncbi:MAG: hypothetical protein HYX20_01705 [Candidatus Yanofskybacteria bacterium]|nr:hypothetical protein [Candidatus Yanofskybacteria bacterium]